MVRAAGGLVVRLSATFELEFAVVHRPARRDWSLPKGKLDPGERLEDCALREVLEETGFACRLGPWAGRTTYRDRRDRPKVVDYWVMDVVDGAFRPSEEVDRLRWAAVPAAADLLTYPRDVGLVEQAAATLLARSG